jgi:TPR repeat protein
MFCCVVLCCVVRLCYSALYCRGLGVEEDEVRGVRWFQYAAHRGMPEAMFALGQAFERGVGAEMDLMQAAQWYTEAANRGLPQAEPALRALQPRVQQAMADTLSKLGAQTEKTVKAKADAPAAK